MHAVPKTAVEITILLVAGLIVALIGNQCVGRTLNIFEQKFKDWDVEAGKARPGGDSTKKVAGTGVAKTSGPTKQDPTIGDPGSTDPNGAGTDPKVDAPPVETPPDIGEKKWDGDYGCYRLRGIKVIEFADVQNYADLGDEVCLLIDARKMDNYTDGHIPGAYQVDYYQLSEQIEKIRDQLGVDFIIVYCNGGDCEDSLALAHDLIFEYQVDDFRVWVYEGGYEEWFKKKKQPIVKGEARR